MPLPSTWKICSNGWSISRSPIRASPLGKDASIKLLKEAARGVSLSNEEAWSFIRKGLLAESEDRGMYRLRCRLSIRSAATHKPPIRSRSQRMGRIDVSSPAAKQPAAKDLLTTGGLPLAPTQKGSPQEQVASSAAVAAARLCAAGARQGLWRAAGAPRGLRGLPSSRPGLQGRPGSSRLGLRPGGGSGEAACGQVGSLPSCVHLAPALALLVALSGLAHLLGALLVSAQGAAVLLASITDGAHGRQGVAATAVEQALRLLRTTARPGCRAVAESGV